MSHTSTSATRADVYSRVTAEIIAAIEQGAGEWHAPWFHNGTSAARATNVASDKRYRGINAVALWVAAMAGGYDDGLWGTYRQWQDAGAQVRKGERSTTVVLCYGSRSLPANRLATLTTIMKMAIAECSLEPFRCSTSRRSTDTSARRRTR